MEVERLDAPDGFDVIGDVHGEHAALIELVGLLGYDDTGAHPDGRRLVFVGDLVDYGPSPVEVVRTIAAMRSASCVMGNHDWKHVRWGMGRPVKMSARRIETAVRVGADRDLSAWLSARPAVVEVRAGGLMVGHVSHAGLPSAFWSDPLSREAVDLCLYGMVDGTRDGVGAPNRDYRWVTDRVVDDTSPWIVHGHQRRPVPTTNRVVAVDGGAGKGGSLTAARFDAPYRQPPNFVCVPTPLSERHERQRN